SLPRALGGPLPPAPRTDDGARDAGRNAADVAGPGRGRRAERAARTRGDRRAHAGHGVHPVLRAAGLLLAAPPRAAPGGGRVNGATRSRPNPGLLGLVLFFAALLLVGVVPRVRARFERERDAQARAEALPRVAITRARPAPGSDLSLPGSALPLQQATIYARVNGYLERRLVDIGDTVRSGQLLAVISAPELDQQLAQAQAEL